MERDKDLVRSIKQKAGKRRTYFFDIRQTKNQDYYLTITESVRKQEEDRFERHTLYIYKEDLNRFIQSLLETKDFLKSELMPDYDFDAFQNQVREENPNQNEWEDNWK